MSLSDWGVSDIITLHHLTVISTVYRSIVAISSLVVKLYKVFKDGSGDYRRISEEAKSLRITVDGAVHFLKSTTLNKRKQLEGREILQGCQNILRDFDAFIKNYKSLASSNQWQWRQVFKRFSPGSEDNTTLRIRLISNTILLSNFIRRFVYCHFIYRIRCYLTSLYSSCEHFKMQEQLTKLLDFHRTNSIVSTTFAAAMAGSGGSKDALEELWRDLNRPRVTEDMISGLDTETLGISEHLQNWAGPVVDINVEDQGQSQVADEYTADAGIPLPTITTLDDHTPAGGDTTQPLLIFTPNLADTIWTRAQSWYERARLQMDPIAGPLTPVAALTWITKLLMSLNYIGNIGFAVGSNQTTLHKAAPKVHVDVADLPLKRSASTDYIDVPKNAPPHFAVSEGYADGARLLLDSVDAMGGLQFTPLHVAAREGHTEVVELLCNNGAFIDAVDKFNYTPLHLAARQGHTDVVKLLLQNGASIDAMDMFQYSPLHFAATGGHPRTVKVLLDKGAKMIHGESALHTLVQPQLNRNRAM